MKFMKLGSKPDQFQTDGENIRYVATDLATDAVVNVGDTKFYLHKFPLLSKSARLQKLVSCTGDETNDEINIHDIPGGPASFEICVKFCYGMTVTLNAYNVVAARCAAEYLEMYETVEKGNLIYKIQVFLTSSIFRSWKDSIIVLQTTKSLLPWSEELKIVSHSLDCIASKASIDPSKVEWSYTYNRKKLPSENDWNGVKKQSIVPHDWWVEDLCDLHIDLYKRVITTIKSKGKVSSSVIGEALQAYTIRKLPGFTKGITQGSGNNNNNNNLAKYKYLIDTITTLLPFEKNTVSCSFLLRLLQANISFECGEIEKNEVMKRISYRLEDASVGDLLIRASSNEGTKYNFDLVRELAERFVTQEQNTEIEYDIVSDASKAKVARLIDGYLTEASRDPNLSLIKFMELSEMVSGFPRPSHDGLYRAIDMYLKEHQEITKSERKRICKLIDCRKLSAEACTHAVQNERLPMRLVVQILFFEQMRVVPGGSQGSSRSATTNTEDDWDALPTTEELKALKGELATLRLRDGGVQTNAEKVAENKVKGVVMSKLFSRLWSNKDRQSENSSSETSTSAEDTKSTPSRSRRQSLS